MYKPSTGVDLQVNERLSEMQKQIYWLEKETLRLTRIVEQEILFKAKA